MSDSEVKNPAPFDDFWIRRDSRRSWCVCLGASFLVGISMAMSNSFGVLFVSLLDEFKRGKGETAWIGSLEFIWFMLLSPLSIHLTTHFGFRRTVIVGSILFCLGLFLSSLAQKLTVLYLTYSLVLGTGTCLLYIPAVTVLPFCFRMHLATASGIVIACNGLFTMWIGPVYEYLIRRYGWRMALKLLTILIVPLGFGCALFPGKGQVLVEERKPSEIAIKPDSLVRFLRNKAFLLWTFIMYLVYLGIFVPFVHLVSFSKDIGIAPSVSVYSISCMCVLDAIGKVVFGRILDYFDCNVHRINSIVILTMAVSITLLPLANTVFHIFAFAAVYGFAMGVQCLLVFIITPQVCQPNDSKRAITYLFAALSIPGGVGPFIAAWIYDSTYSYHLAFFIAGGFFAAGSILADILPSLIGETNENPDDIIITKEEC